MEKKPLVREKIAEDLRQYISRMQSDKQVRISSERELAESFGVSRITLRSAIKELVHEGLLIQLTGKGTYIVPKSNLHRIDLVCSPKIKNHDPFYLKFLSELTSAASRQSLQIHLRDLHRSEAVTPDVPLIILGLFEDSTLISDLISSYHTVIAVQDYNNLGDAISQIYFNDYKIGWQAAQLLADYRHKNTLLLAGPDRYPSAYYRMKGFLEGMEHLGLHTYLHQEKMNWTGGYLSGDYYLKEIPKKARPSAVFASNDWMAIGFVQKLKEHGIRIPEDISVIGCDDIPLANEFFPSLTTFNLDMKLLVMELFTLLNRLSASNEKSIEKVVLPASLILRDSLRKL